MKLKEKAKCEPIARTGRVQDWLDSPDGRLPVSCTVFNVEDSRAKMALKRLGGLLAMACAMVRGSLFICLLCAKGALKMAKAWWQADQ
jgi:hypothetical protein